MYLCEMVHEIRIKKRFVTLLSGLEQRAESRPQRRNGVRKGNAKRKKASGVQTGRRNRSSHTSTFSTQTDPLIPSAGHRRAPGRNVQENTQRQIDGNLSSSAAWFESRSDLPPLPSSVGVLVQVKADSDSEQVEEEGEEDEKTSDQTRVRVPESVVYLSSYYIKDVTLQSDSRSSLWCVFPGQRRLLLWRPQEKQQTCRGVACSGESLDPLPGGGGVVRMFQ